MNYLCFCVTIQLYTVEDLKVFAEVLDEVETRRMKTRHLKRVEFSDFYVEEAALAAQLLLKHGNVLEEIVFTWDNEFEYNIEAMEVINQVSEFDKASSSVKLITVLKTRHFRYVQMYQSCVGGFWI